MAVALNPDARLSRTTSTAWNVYFSWCGWRRLDTDRGQFTILTYLGHSLIGGGFQFTVNASRKLIVYDVNNFSDLLGGVGPTLAVGDWWFFGLTTVAADEPNNVVIYYAQEGATSLTSVTASYSGPYDYTQHYVGARPGNDGDSGAYFLDGSAAHDHSWSDTTLTPSEMLAEFESETPVKAGVWADWPMADAATATTDASGNSRPLTATTGTGSIVDTDGPAFGAATTATLDATLPALTADFAGSATATGTASSILPALSGAFTAEAHVDAQLTAALPPLVAAAQGEAHSDVQVGATLPGLTTDLTAAASSPGEITAPLPALATTLTGAATGTGVVAGALPSLAASLTGTALATGTLTATLPSLAVALSTLTITNPAHGTYRETGEGTYAEAGYRGTFREAG